MCFEKGIRGLIVGSQCVTDDRRNIKVSGGTFEALKADKPDGVTWDYYLTEIRTPE